MSCFAGISLRFGLRCHHRVLTRKHADGPDASAPGPPEPAQQPRKIGDFPGQKKSDALSGGAVRYRVVDDGIWQLCEEVCGAVERQLESLDAALHGPES